MNPSVSSVCPPPVSRVSGVSLLCQWEVLWSFTGLRDFSRWAHHFGFSTNDKTGVFPSSVVNK